MKSKHWITEIDRKTRISCKNIKKSKFFWLQPIKMDKREDIFCAYCGMKMILELHPKTHAYEIIAEGENI